MIRPLVILFAISALGLISADAKTFKVPNDEFPIASINIPDDWDEEEINNGIGASSDDGAVYLSIVAVGNEKGMNAELDDTFEMLKEHNVDLDQNSKKENKFKINNLDAQELVFQGKDEDGPTSVSITFVTVKDKVLVLTYWVNTAEEKKHEKEVGQIVSSLKPAA